MRYSLQRARCKLQIMDTKTAGSERTITDLPETVLKALRKRRARQAEQKLKAGADWTDTGLVFTTSTGKAARAAKRHALLPRTAEAR